MPFPDPSHRNTFEWSFDFSKFPNIQEVTFGVRAYWKEGGLPWAPMALSTLRPATSPRLSVIRLDFCSSTSRMVETVIANMGNDLRRIADEFARIDHEFGGAVNFTVVADSRFQAVLNTLKVRFHLVGRKYPRGHVDSSSFVPCRSFSTTFVDTGRLSLPLASCRSPSSFFHPAAWACGVGVFSSWSLGAGLAAQFSFHQELMHGNDRGPT